MWGGIMTNKNLGHATAYAYYKAGGGTMTEAEFTEFMADFGTASQTAVEAARAALASETAARNASTTATNKASEATTAAQTATTKAGEASTSASTATSAKDTAVSASQTATSKASEATTAATSANTAKTDAVAAKTAAQTAQTAAETAQGKAETAQGKAEDAAESVSASAAQIKTNKEDITELKSDLSDVKSAIEQISNDNLPMIFVKGEYVALNGNFLSSPAWSRTEFIRVDKYSEIIITSTKQSAYNCFYDEDHNHIASFNCAVGAMHRLIPANAVYIALSNETQNMLETTVVPYTVKKETAINDAIEELTEIKTNKFTTSAQDYLYELYLTGFDFSKNIIIGQIANKYVVGDGYYSGIYFAYEDAPTAWIAAWSTAYDIQTPCIVKLNEMNSSGITGYACLDFKKITEGTRIYPRIVVNKEYIKDVGKSPSIVSYVNGYNSTDINWLNKDMDMAVIQASQTKARLFPGYDASLEFVHFTDVHGAAEAWKRIIDYINSHDSYIQFALHTGDYVISAQDSSVDLYGTVTPNRRPILNVVGNHDVQVTDGPAQAAQADTYNLLFSDSANWGATFPQVANAMYYYKDFANKNLRFIMIDQYYWNEAEATWLGSVLEDARTHGYHVVTASHTQSGPFGRMLKTTFNTIDDYEPYTQWGENVEPFELLIKNFKDAGGKHVANLCGHWHHDMSGVTKNGILNLVAECATPFGMPWVNTPRIAGTRSYDCFNVVSVDTVANIIRLIRIEINMMGIYSTKQLSALTM